MSNPRPEVGDKIKFDKAVESFTVSYIDDKVMSIIDEEDRDKTTTHDLWFNFKIVYKAKEALIKKLLKE